MRACVCVCACVHTPSYAFKACMFLHVYTRVGGGGEPVIVLKWLEPSSGAVCLITVEQSPLISHCSPICLLQTSNLHTEPSHPSCPYFTSAVQLCHVYSSCSHAAYYQQWREGWFLSEEQAQPFQRHQSQRRSHSWNHIQARTH